MKNFRILVILFSLVACVFSQKAIQSPEPQARAQTQPYFETNLKPKIGTENTASIGDLVLSYTKYRYSAEKLLASAPNGLDHLPLAGWEKTHQYDSKVVCEQEEPGTYLERLSSAEFQR
jgi:hypothetical protein